MPPIGRERWRDLEPLLDRALELSAEERASWLEELRARSPALAAELSVILAREATADEGGFLAQPPVSPVGLAGLELGAYTLERPLGQGGMGSVWLARRTDGRFEGQAAVKLMNLALVSPTARERFRREGTVLARLAHPGIARLLDAGVAPSGQPYLVLEYVAGERIDAFAEARGLSREQRIGLLLQVLDAVGHAHANLIVHRDIKPSNILVTADGTVKLLDFGIAKLLEGEGSGERTALTADGRALTPDYAAPEQVRGEVVTTATDVYASGVLLYLLLSGRHPTTTPSATPAEAVRGILETEPARLGVGDLDTIIAKVLRKTPGERYQTVTAFADDLRRYLRQEPVSARPDSLAYRVGKFVRRNRAAVMAGLLTAAGLLGATGFSLRQMRVARFQRDAAVRESRRADAQVEFQNVLLSEVGDRPITMREVLDAGRDVLEGQSAGDVRIRTALLLQLAASYAALHDSRMRETLLVRAESLALAGGAGDRLPEIGCQLADNLRLDGRYEEAWRKLDAAEALRRSVAPHDRGVEVACLTAHSALATEAGQPWGRSGEGITAARRGIAIKDSLGQTGDMAYVDLLSTLAGALYRAERPREAIAILKRAVAVMDSSGRGGLLAYTVLRHDLALALVNLGETAEAERILHEALQRAERSDRSGRISWQPVIHYAETALTQGHADSAAKYFAMIVAQGVRETSLFWEGRGLFGLARADVQLGRLAEARRAKVRLEQIITTFPRVRNTDDQVPDGQVLDAWLALARGDTAAAKADLLAALRTNGYFEGKRGKRLRPVVLLTAECAVALGQVQEALALAREARAIAAVDALADARSAAVGDARLVEARALLAGGDSVGARAALDRALPALRFGAGADHPRTRQAEALVRLLRPGGAGSVPSRSVR